MVHCARVNPCSDASSPLHPASALRKLDRIDSFPPFTKRHAFRLFSPHKVIGLPVTLSLQRRPRQVPEPHRVCPAVSIGVHVPVHLPRSLPSPPNGRLNVGEALTAGARVFVLIRPPAVGREQESGASKAAAIQERVSVLK